MIMKDLVPLAALARISGWLRVPVRYVKCYHPEIRASALPRLKIAIMKR
jgi:hypothetical protein